MNSVLIVLLALLVAGCAADIPRQPATLDAPTEGAVGDRSIQIDEEAHVSLPGGYSRTIRAGSTWKRVGRIGEHDVFKPARDVFTIEGSHVHEAYLLVQGNVLEGFFLPGENAVSFLKRKVDLKFH